MILMDGKKIAKERFFKLEEKIKQSGVALSLAVVQVGENKVSETYIREKKRSLEKSGIRFSVYRFKESISLSKLKESIASFKEDGIIVQLPLPEKFNKREVLDSIPLEKDVDLLSKEACGKFYVGFFETLPPVVRAVEILLLEYKIALEGKTVTLIGSGDLVGKPLAVYLMKKKATVSVVNEKTKDIKFFTKNADIVISGAGVPGIIKGDMVKKNSVIIDAGTSSDEGKMRGDVDRDTVEKVASYLTPVPGGVGPLTVYSIAYNLLYLKNGN